MRRLLSVTFMMSLRFSLFLSSMLLKPSLKMNLLEDEVLKDERRLRGSLWITISSVGHSYYMHAYYQILNVLAICASHLTVKWIHVMETLIVLVSSCSLIEHVHQKL